MLRKRGSEEDADRRSIEGSTAKGILLRHCGEPCNDEGKLSMEHSV